MSLAAGTRLGPYQVVSAIGAGGMGEVYRATDTKLKRPVAIKILPGSLATDHDRLARFQREAEVLASLNHPNIAGIYGLEESGGISALVMELVEGEDLSRRIARGAISLNEALPIARQICEALETAHEQGIIHRDLKPANIKLRPDGTVKVLDFGLAKALAQDGASATAEGMNSPTITTPAMTRAGVILGTAAYMSPEQARGKTVDRRADIWAFGCVLFEMLTGKRTFPGEDLTDTLAAVVRAEPEWTLIPQDVPPTLVVFIRRCLQKDPRQRTQAIGDVRLALDGAFDIPQPARPTPEPRSHARTFMAVAATAALATALVAAATERWWRGSAAAPPSTRLSVMLPSNRPVWKGSFPMRSLALSPDGTELAYVGANLDAAADQPGRTQLQLRALSSLAVRDLPGTAGGRQPFFSPDGQWIGFFTGTGELKKVSLAGGTPVTLAQKINASGLAFGVWTEDGTIIFGTLSSGLRRVSAEGGETTDLTTLNAQEGESFHLFPAVVPSTRALLFTVHYAAGRNSRIEAVMLDSGERRVVVENARTPVVLGSSHLLFQRDAAVLVAPFDGRQLTVTGPAVPLVDEVEGDHRLSPFPVAELAVSSTGTLAYLPAAGDASTLGLVSRSGVFDRIGLPPNNFAFPRVRPDGRAVAFDVVRGRESEIHVYDLVRGSTTKLTQGEYESGAAWHPDSRSLAIYSRRQDGTGIFLKNLDGTERLIVPLPGGVTVLRNASWSPDGTRLAYTVQTGLLHDIWVLTMGNTPTARPFLNSAASEFSPKFSPDGRWLAYGSSESGRAEVYVQQYPQGERLAVSTGGGNGPVWRSDGKELFFEGTVGGAAKLMAVAVAPEGTSLRLAKPIPLFDMRVTSPAGQIEQYSGSSNVGVAYDVLPDGRFVMIRGTDRTSTREIVVVQNWFEELKRLVPMK